MGWRLQRRIRLLPGLRLNVGLNGVSLTAGGRGASVNIGPRGVYRNLGIPGTGLSHRERIDTGAVGDAVAEAGRRVQTLLDLDEHGRLAIKGSDGAPLDPAIERRIRREHEPQLREWLEARRGEIAGDPSGLLGVHLQLETLDTRPEFTHEPFAEPEPPVVPPPLRIGLWDRLLGRVESLQRAHEQAARACATQHAAWFERREAHDAEQARLRQRHEQGVLTDPAVMEQELESTYDLIQWPCETQVDFALEEAGSSLVVEVDLPEVEQMPARSAEFARRGLKLNLRERPAREVSELYATHVHGVLLLVAGAAFGTLPRLDEVVCSGYTQRRDPATGRLVDDTILSVRITRAAWTRLDLTALDAIAPVACLEGFELVRDMSDDFEFNTVTPIARVQGKGTA